jgi:superfamily II DNA helicase RecQ
VPPPEVVAADVGLDLRCGDRSHRVVAVGADHVRTEVAGSARARVPFGTVVEVGGRAVLLAHPAAAEALQALRRWRSARATADQVPAFVVFDDKTLRRIAAVLPTTDAELLGIGGIGPTKLARYGADLRALIDEVRRSAPVGPPTPRRPGVSS